jgi:hypothetical protein
MNRIWKILAILLLLAVAWGGARLDAQEKAQEKGTVAMIYYWKAKPGKMEEYSRYIREVAEPIDFDARDHGAFLSITTYVSQKPDSPWTHMRIFVFRDHAQMEKFGAAIDATEERLQPDEAKRKARGEYAATLRDAAGSEVVEILD